MYSTEDNKMVRCPYNSSHILKNFRLPYHIIKCRANYPGVKLKNCRYNYDHLVRSDEMTAHLEVCPNRILIESGQSVRSSDESRSCTDAGSREDVTKARSSKKPTGSHRELVRKRKEKEPNKSEGGDANKNGGSKNVIDKRMNYKEWYRNVLTNSFEDEYKLKPLPLPKTTSKAFIIRNPSC